MYYDKTAKSLFSLPPTSVEREGYQNSLQQQRVEIQSINKGHEGHSKTSGKRGALEKVCEISSA
jgi:hypothetical protein